LDEIGGAFGERREVPVPDYSVVSARVASAGDVYHLGGDIETDGLEPEGLQEARRSAGAATEVNCAIPHYVLAQEIRQVAEGQVIGAPVPELVVGRGPATVLVGIAKIQLYSPSYRVPSLCVTNEKNTSELALFGDQVWCSGVPCSELSSLVD
jgi:hypothetical protein